MTDRPMSPHLEMPPASVWRQARIGTRSTESPPAVKCPRCQSVLESKGAIVKVKCKGGVWRGDCAKCRATVWPVIYLTQLDPPEEKQKRGTAPQSQGTMW